MFEEMTNASVLSEKKTPLHAYLFYSLIFDLSNYSSFSVVFQKRSKEKKLSFETQLLYNKQRLFFRTFYDF